MTREPGATDKRRLNDKTNKIPAITERLVGLSPRRPPSKPVEGSANAFHTARTTRMKQAQNVARTNTVKSPSSRISPEHIPSSSITKQSLNAHAAENSRRGE